MRFQPAFGRLCLAAIGAFLVVAPVALSAQWSEDDRRRAVGDWLVEDVGDEEGGRTLRLLREEGDYSLDYHMNLRPGAGDYESQGFLVWRLTCGQGGEESLDGGHSAVEASEIRARLTAYLERCETPEEDAAVLLEHFDRTFALLTDWAAERQASLLSGDALAAAEAALDAAANAVEAMDMNMTTDMGDYEMTADPENMTDLNLPGDVNYSEDIATNASETGEPN